jgi:hypothetical protein
MKPFTRWKVVLGLFVVFVAGGMSGSFFTAVYIRHQFEKSLKFENWSAAALDNLQEKVHLDPDQRKKVQGLLDDAVSDLRLIFGRTMNETGKTIVHLQKRIDFELNPDQRKIHAAMIQEFWSSIKQGLHFEPPPE